jgi:hypothetical protein
MFSSDAESQILHVTHDGDHAKVDAVSGAMKGFRVLDDLDVRASDLLQTNVVVWVEGPSDRLYFKKWIELWSSGKLVEGIHFQCVPFGGSANAHWAFGPPEDVEGMIAAMMINRNAILLIDSDKDEDASKLKVHTARLVAEIENNRGYAWVTEGREVENYIPATVFQKIFDDPSLRGPGQFADVLTYCAKKNNNVLQPKVAFAHKVVGLLLRDALQQTLDMELRLTEVCSLIRKWNRIE